MKSVTNTNKSANNDSGLLEKIAKTLDPPGQEVSDAELIDPGANIQDQADPEKSAPKPVKSGAGRLQHGKNQAEAGKQSGRQ